MKTNSNKPVGDQLHEAFASTLPGYKKYPEEFVLGNVPPSYLLEGLDESSGVIPTLCFLAYREKNGKILVWPGLVPARAKQICGRCVVTTKGIIVFDLRSGRGDQYFAEDKVKEYGRTLAEPWQCQAFFQQKQDLEDVVDVLMENGVKAMKFQEGSVDTIVWTSERGTVFSLRHGNSWHKDAFSQNVQFLVVVAFIPFQS